MKIRVIHVIPICALLLNNLALAQDPDRSDIQALREELEQMRVEYETRISDLESRLEAAEITAARSQFRH